MAATVASADIPNRSVFRAQEVCELVQVQPYVLRSWEAEFPDLGVAKGPGSPRLYRRGDVDKVRRLKHLLFVDGLTLAGARRRLSDEGVIAPLEPIADADVAAMLDADARDRIREIKRGLEWLLETLSATAGVRAADFELRAQPVAASVRSARRSPAPPAPAKAGKHAGKAKSKKKQA